MVFLRSVSRIPVQPRLGGRFNTRSPRKRFVSALNRGAGQAFFPREQTGFHRWSGHSTEGIPGDLQRGFLNKGFDGLDLPVDRAFLFSGSGRDRSRLGSGVYRWLCLRPGEFSHHTCCKTLNPPAPGFPHFLNKFYQRQAPGSHRAQEQLYTGLLVARREHWQCQQGEQGVPGGPRVPSASRRLTRSTVLKKRPRDPARMQLRAIASARWVFPVPVPPISTMLRCCAMKPPFNQVAHQALVDRRYRRRRSRRHPWQAAAWRWSAGI